jgi:hypothetical protein
MKTEAIRYTNNWEQSNLQEFWGNVASNDHLVQFYDHEKSFLDTLEGFAGSGFLAGETVIVIATRSHLDALNARLQQHGFDLISLVATDQYIPLDAIDTLNLFMVDDKPDKSLFEYHIKGFINQTRKEGRKVRAFGEMVAVLWENGQYDAAVDLENLWCGLHHLDSFSLYCAYPKASMPLSTTHLNAICQSHTMLIEGEMGMTTAVQYQHIHQRQAAKQ